MSRRLLGKICNFSPAMLKLTVVMSRRMFDLSRAFVLFLALAALFFSSGRPLFARAQDLQPTPQPTGLPAPQAAIFTPTDGDALQGVINIQGTSALPGFRAAEVAFAYQANPTGTWFLINQNPQPVEDGTLAVWDTTTITDGEYRLRLQVFFEDGQVAEQITSGLRVRNYTPVETSVPVPQNVEPQPDQPAQPSGRPTPVPTITPAADFQPAPPDAQPRDPAPTNPAVITRGDLESYAARGVLVVFGALLLSLLYLGLRALLRR